MWVWLADVYHNSSLCEKCLLHPIKTTIFTLLNQIFGTWVLLYISWLQCLRLSKFKAESPWSNICGRSGSTMTYCIREWVLFPLSLALYLLQWNQCVPPASGFYFYRRVRRAFLNPQGFLYFIHYLRATSFPEELQQWKQEAQFQFLKQSWKLFSFSIASHLILDFKVCW